MATDLDDQLTSYFAWVEQQLGMPMRRAPHDPSADAHPASTNSIEVRPFHRPNRSGRRYAAVVSLVAMVGLAAFLYSGARDPGPGPAQQLSPASESDPSGLGSASSASSSDVSVDPTSPDPATTTPIPVEEVSVDELRDRLPQFRADPSSETNMTLADETFTVVLSPTTIDGSPGVCLTAVRVDGSRLAGCNPGDSTGLIEGVTFLDGRQDSILLLATSQQVDVSAEAPCEISNQALSSTVHVIGCALGSFSGQLKITFTTPDSSYTTVIEIPNLATFESVPG
jgi:hypothetical protein